jgi:hypothetical protein
MIKEEIMVKEIVDNDVRLTTDIMPSIELTFDHFANMC